MQTIMIPVAITVWSALLAHAATDEAKGRDSTQYLLRVTRYGNAAIVSAGAWVLWWAI
ncbi:hypothetical protein ACMHYO_14070 [Allopusillimonas ginsengisoli]|uniref:hypothetical protein n=1 Tax=Allopusillimonas ginsengisoli TaxID=453575 RepID=UPI0039C46B43